MTAQTCALPRCYKPPWPSAPGDAPHLACGNLHHQLLMASRFSPALPHPYQAILDRNAAGLCALLSCEKLPYMGHSWCSRTHYRVWLTEFTSGLHPDHEICMLPGCTCHVFVDENAPPSVFVDDYAPPSRFCGWRHQQKFVMRSALQRCQQDPLLSIEDWLLEPHLPAPLNESDCGHLPSLDSLMHSLKQFALSGIAPKNIRVIDDFYDKHPWEVSTEGNACWLIARLKFTSKGRELTTKGHYHWKQSGPRAKKRNHTEKYYTYTRRKGREREADQRHAESAPYTIKEYTMEDVKSYSLIQLVKEKPSSNGKLGKEQSSKQQNADQVNNVWSQDTAKLSIWDDYMSDSIFRDLLEDLGQETAGPRPPAPHPGSAMLAPNCT